MSEIEEEAFLFTGSSALKKIISLMFDPEKQQGKDIESTQFPLNQMIPDFFTKDIQCFGLTHQEPSSTKSNTPSNSFVRFSIPLGSNVNSQLPFENTTSKQIRIGRIIQLMDSLAGLSAVKYTNLKFNSKQTPFTIVTASIDHIFIDDVISCEQDLILQSYVNFVGSTSAQIEVNLLQNNVLKASAFFTMVTRDSTFIGKGGKGYPMPTLEFTGQSQLNKCLQRQKRGKSFREARILRSKTSLQMTTPTQQQIKVLHDFFIQKTRPDDCITISKTTTYKSILMQSQYRNINNKIFGGFLLRQMIETASFVGRKITMDSKLRIQRLQDIFFTEPVEIGEGIEIKSQAVYSHNMFVVIKTEVHKIIFKDGSKVKACQLYATFSRVDKNKIIQILPESYSEGIDYLLGRRLLNRIQGLLPEQNKSN